MLINKADTLLPEDAEAEAARVIEALGWTGPWFLVSGLAHDGTREVMLKVQAALDELDRSEREAADAL